ncbi:hypothetical protein GCM10027605_50220 [Micromonospora zhanjiangensis]
MGLAGRGTAVALVRSGVSSDWGARLLREFLVTQILRRALAGLDLDPAEAPLRGSLVASQMAGMAIMRYIIKLEPLASAPAEVVVATLGPTIQRYVTGDLTDAVRLLGATGTGPATDRATGPTD